MLAFLVSEDGFFTGKGTRLASGSEIRTFVQDLKGVTAALASLYKGAILREWMVDEMKLSSALEGETEDLGVPDGKPVNSDRLLVFRNAHREGGPRAHIEGDRSRQHLVRRSLRT